MIFEQLVRVSFQSKRLACELLAMVGLLVYKGGLGAASKSRPPTLQGTGAFWKMLTMGFLVYKGVLGATCEWWLSSLQGRPGSC